MNQIRLHSYMSRFLPKPRFYSRSSFNPGTIDDQKFSLIQPRSLESLCNGRGTETKNSIRGSFDVLGSGMIRLRNHIRLKDQVEIVNECEKLGEGFVKLIPHEEKIGLHMMLLGLEWKTQACDESSLKQLLVPDKILSLVNSSIHDSQSYVYSEDKISSVCSYHCAVKFYTNTGELTLQKESDDDSWYPHKTKGWPVVSICIGDSAEFFYSDLSNVDKPKTILLKSGDVLIFGNNFRNISHGLRKIIPNSAPLPLLKKTMLKPGLLNLSFREF